jgi:hypothetical protein
MNVPRKHPSDASGTRKQRNVSFKRLFVSTNLYSEWSVRVFQVVWWLRWSKKLIFIWYFLNTNRNVHHLWDARY